MAAEWKTMTASCIPCSTTVPLISTSGDLTTARANASLSQKQILKSLHDDYYKTRQDTETQITYMLDATEFIKNGDLDGWIQKFAPHLLQSHDLQKKSRMSSNRIKIPPPELCTECGGATFEDVWQGRVVCTMCGLIHRSSVLVQAADMSVFGIQPNSSTNSTSAIHEYSRLVYFKSVLLAIEGVTLPTITSRDFQLISESCTIATAGEPSKVTEKHVRSAIRTLKLPKSLLRHCQALAGKLGSRDANAVNFDFSRDAPQRLYRAFRAVEVKWGEKSQKIKEIFNRKSFFNYRFLLRKLVKAINIDYSGTLPIIRTKSLLAKQERLFNFVCHEINFSEFQCKQKIQ